MVIKILKTNLSVLRRKCLQLLDFIIPKKLELIVFSSSHYIDNLKIYFEYLNQIQSEFEPIWLAKNKDIISNIQSINKNYKVYPILSLKGYWTLLRAKFVIMSHGNWDYYSFLNPNSSKITINFWHGISMKSIGLSTLNNTLPKNYNFGWDHMLASSLMEKNLLVKSFNLKPENVPIIGIPRNEIIYRVKEDEQLKNKVMNKIKQNLKFNPKKIILYTPTYRLNEKINVFPFDDYDQIKLTQYFKDNNILCILRFHPNEDIKDNKKVLKILTHQNFILGDQISFPEITSLFLISDLLITDYSSTYFDFLFFERPTLFFPYDFETYSTSIGFFWDYQHLVYGNSVYLQSDLLQRLENDLIKDNFDRESLRLEFKNIHQYDPNNVSKLITDFIRNKL